MTTSHHLLIVSGGTGASAEQVVYTVLAQFPRNQVQVSRVTSVRHREQVDEAISRAQRLGATLVHTLVDNDLRRYLVEQAASQGVAAVDLMGPLLEQLSGVLSQPPLGQPGLYRKLNKAYFDRVAAIEYTIAHDDGVKPETWSQAEMVLLGVSRVGKTPLSLYLSVLGWKVANVPLVPGIEPAPELFTLNRQRVFGLAVDSGQLLAHRLQRQRRLGVSGPSDYIDPDSIALELKYAAEIFQRGGFNVIDVTDKPIESTADELIRRVTRLSE